MNDIKDFKKLDYHKSFDEKPSQSEAEKPELNQDSYLSLEQCAYRSAHDISNGWTKEVPEWKDVQEGYRRGAEDGMKYTERVLTEVFKRLAKGTGIFKDNK